MFIYKGSNKKIIKTTIAANRSSLLNSVRVAMLSEKFEASTATSEELSKGFYDYLNSNTVFVLTYHKRFSKAVAFFEPSVPNVININTAKLNRSTSSIIGTFYHEAIHAFDQVDDRNMFGHGDNSSVGKQNTVPYRVGALAEIFSRGDIVYNRPKRLSLWSKFKRWFT